VKPTGDRAVDGVREGKGTLTKADGTVIEGVWKAGELQGV